MRKKPIAIQEISSGIPAADDRGYNGLVRLVYGELADNLNSLL
jgi:hypothetical protein